MAGSWQGNARQASQTEEEKTTNSPGGYTTTDDDRDDCAVGNDAGDSTNAHHARAPGAGEGDRGPTTGAGPAQANAPATPSAQDK